MAPIRNPTVHRHGLTILEVLALIVIIGILVLLLVPFRMHAGQSAQVANCQINQKQIILAMVAYQTDHLQRWPAAFTGNPAAQQPEGFATALASLELLVWETGNEIPNKVFACPMEPDFQPRSPASQVPSVEASSWASAAPDASAEATPGYAYDWSAPATARSSRPVVGDRGEQSHDGKVMVAFADGHIDRLYATLDGSPGDTHSLGTTTTPARVTINPESESTSDVPDNIFNRSGDEDDMLRPASGSASRAWLR